MEREAAVVSILREGRRRSCVRERLITSTCSILDMLQAIGWNSIERTPSDWERLFTSADRRLRFMGTRTPPGSSLSFIEARFEDPAAE